MLHGTGPEHVAQGDAVVIHVKAGNSGLNGPDDGVIVAAADIVPLHPQKAVAVLVGQGPPGGVEIGAVAPVGVIGGREPVADGAVVCIRGGLAPPEKGPGDVAAAGELIRTVGLAAGVAGAGGNDPRAAGFKALAQCAQQLLLLVIGGGGRCEHRQDHRNGRHQQRQAKQNTCPSTHGFHRITPLQSM